MSFLKRPTANLTSMASSFEQKVEDDVQEPIEFNEQEFMNELFAAEKVARSHGTSILELLELVAQQHNRISLKE